MLEQEHRDPEIVDLIGQLFLPSYDPKIRNKRTLYDTNVASKFYII